MLFIEVKEYNILEGRSEIEVVVRATDRGVRNNLHTNYFLNYT